MGFRRNIAFLFIVALISVSPVFAAGQLQMESRTWDAGDIELGARIDYEFVFTNSGDAPIHILSVRPQCACTVPDGYDEVIPPGASTALKLVVDTRTLHPGTVSKSVTIRTDAPGSERVILQIKMNLFTPLEILPRATVYLSGRQGDSPDSKLLARPHRDGMKITGVVSNNEHIEVSLEAAEPIARKDGPATGLANQMLPRAGDFWVNIKVKPGAPVGLLSGRVDVKTSDPEHPVGAIQVRANIKERPSG